MAKSDKKRKTKPLNLKGVRIREIRPSYYLADFVKDNKRIRKCFDTIAEAKLWADTLTRDVLNKGTAALQLPEKVKSAIPGLIQKLNGRATLEEVVEYWLKRNPDDNQAEVWEETLERYIIYMEEHGCRSASITDKRVKCKVLGELMEHPKTVSVDEQLLKNITAEYAKKFKLSLLTQKSYLSAGMTLWRFFNGKNRQHSDKDQKAPATWKADFIEKMFRIAEELAPSIIPSLAVQTFGGLRPTEATRLTWDDIRFDDNLITLAGEQTKTRHARNVTMSPNLKQWLLAYKGTGKIVASDITFRRSRNKIRDSLKLAVWENDVLRHTCATMFYAKTHDIKLTASELGHLNTETFLTFYKGNPPMPEDVTKFWSITPNKKGLQK